jgi:hypothetical protein
MRRRWPWVAAWFVIAGVLLGLGAAFRLGGLAEVADIAAVVALPPLAMQALAWARQFSARSDTPTHEQLESARRTLAGRVHGQWLNEVRGMRLRDREPVAVLWRLVRQTGDDGAAETRGGTPVIASSAEADKLAGMFWRAEPRRLVILGEAGMGKTTLAILLLTELLHSDDRRPVPVLFSLASYDGQDSFDSWLTEMLRRDYPFLCAPSYGHDAPAELVRQRWILPVLDGLDEVAKSAQRKVIDAVNDALADGVLDVILTCRTADYEDAVQEGKDLLIADVIAPEPVSGQDAVDYLTARVPQSQRSAWHPVFECLASNPDAPLSRALISPLMLWLVRNVYLNGEQDTGRLLSPAELTDTSLFPTPIAVTRHLLDALIPSLIEANPPNRAEPGRPRRRWDIPHTQQWLIYLAGTLEEENTASLAWWRLWQVVPLAVLALGTGIAVAFGAGVGAGLPAGPTVGPVMAGLVVGPVAGLTGALGVGLLFATWRRPGRRWTTRGWPGLRRIATGFVSAPGAVLVTALGAGLTLGLAYGLSSGISRGVAAGVAAGGGPALAATVAAGLGVAFAAARRTAPELARRLKWHFSVRRALAALASGFVIGAAVGLQYGLGYGTACGLAGCASIGLAAVLEGAQEEPEAMSPQAALRQDRRLALLVVLASGVGIGFVLGVGLPVGTGLGVGVSTGLCFALLVSMLRTPWPSYELARCWLALWGRLPWRLMTFLGDAHRLGILRQVGTVYQFRHLELQRHLASKQP